MDTLFRELTMSLNESCEMCPAHFSPPPIDPVIPTIINEIMSVAIILNLCPDFFFPEKIAGHLTLYSYKINNIWLCCLFLESISNLLTLLFSMPFFIQYQQWVSDEDRGVRTGQNTYHQDKNEGGRNRTAKEVECEQSQQNS